MPSFILIALVFTTLNLATFAAFWRDKSQARARGQRIPERTLLWLAFVGGSIGAATAQQAFRHKTQKEPFRSWLNAIICLHAALLVTALAIWLGRPA